MLSLLLGLSIALGSASDCVQCCRDLGMAGCPTRIRMFGPDSVNTTEGTNHRAQGLWWIDCDKGAQFDHGATVVTQRPSVNGEILHGASPAETIDCFRKSCALPRGACLGRAPGTREFFLIRCSDGQPLTDAELRVQGAPPRISQRTKVRFDLPAPPTRCAGTEALENAAREQVSKGRQLAIRNDSSAAQGHFRAALSMDPCNGFAWGGLGRIALKAGALEPAVTALETATKLEASNIGALYDLGQAYERIGKRTQAHQVYSRITNIDPSHNGANEGLSRTQPMR